VPTELAQAQGYALLRGRASDGEALLQLFQRDARLDLQVLTQALRELQVIACPCNELPGTLAARFVRGEGGCHGRSYISNRR
jgi:hypothetical protein